ncbi:GAF domain-like protein [Hysterangium stoloniferum]|nr:GAF domain-like protein [Hysterangium stoloniferum]
MPHADSSCISLDITTKAAFYDHVAVQLEALLGGQRNWISNLSNAAALLYHSFLSFPSHFGATDRAVNWSGFYLEASMFPSAISEKSTAQGLLLLGPFSGKPACQFIRAQAGKGVCADAFVSQKTVIVENVEAYPGHIACDGGTKSEIVLPIMVNGAAVGVLDLDCLALGGFNEDDQNGLENIVRIIVNSCDWSA